MCQGHQPPNSLKVAPIPLFFLPCPQAIKGYVHAARGRLLRQAHKTLSTHMLLGRREAMDQALLAVVLPPGVAPPRADVDDGSV